MKDGLRFVDCDMHVMEPADLSDRYLDPRFKHRVSTLVGRAANPCRDRGSPTPDTSSSPSSAITTPQVMAMAMKGVDIAVLYPTSGLSLIARDHMDPELSLALCQAYNWLVVMRRVSHGVAPSCRKKADGKFDWRTPAWGTRSPGGHHRPRDSSFTLSQNITATSKPPFW